MDATDKHREINERRALLLKGGGDEEIDKQHRRGKLTARERIERLLDKGSFSEVDLWSTPLETGFDIDGQTLQGDGVVAGYGDINGQSVCVWSQDYTLIEGRAGIIHVQKIARLLEKALNARVPFIGITDSEGLKVEDMLSAPTACSYDRLAYLQTTSSGVIPQISLVMGPCKGMAALSAMLSDFVLMVKDTSDMRIASFSEEADEDENGAAWMHAKNSGCCDLIAENDEDCLKQCRDLLGFLPSNNNGIIRQHATDDRPDRKEEELMTIVPVDQSKTYNMKKLIALLVDNGNFLEIKRHWAANLIVGFARLDGYSVGIVANNPQNRGGCMDMNAADKMARFVRFCDAFHIPLIWLIDTPAFLPAVEEERGGIIRHGAKVVSANSLATVPQISVYIRKCYGGGNLAMPGENLGGDMTFAWPTAVVSPMIPDGAVAILYRKEIQAAENPAKIHEERVKEFEKSTGGILWRCIPVQEFIDPRETRFVLIKALRRLSDKHEETAWRRHDNIPL